MRKENNEKENSPELQKPNIEVEIYNNRQCDYVYTYTSTAISKVKTVQQK